MAKPRPSTVDFFPGCAAFPAGRALLGALAVAACFAVSARSLEIPLKRGSREGTRVGFVDMEKIFREYPETQKARADYFKELERRRADLADKEREVTRLEGEADAWEETISPPAVSTGLFTLPPVLASSATAAAPPLSPAPGAELALSSSTVPGGGQSLARREAEIKKRREELDAARQSAAKMLKDLEDKRSLQILGSLYKALVQVAEEKGVEMVVDKTAILYGQNAVDLTEALSRRVRGLPDWGKTP